MQKGHSVKSSLLDSFVGKRWKKNHKIGQMNVCWFDNNRNIQNLLFFALVFRCAFEKTTIFYMFNDYVLIIIISYYSK